MGAKLVSYKKQGRDEASGWSYDVMVTVKPSKECALFPEYGLLVVVGMADFKYDEDSCICRCDFELFGGVTESYREALTHALGLRGVPVAACNDAFSLIFAHTYNYYYDVRDEEIEARIRVDTYVPEEEIWAPIDTHSMLL